MQIEQTLNSLLTRDELSDVTFSSENLDALKFLAARTPDAVIGYGLHEYVDEVQIALNRLGEQIDQAFFLAHYAAA